MTVPLEAVALHLIHLPLHKSDPLIHIHTLTPCERTLLIDLGFFPKDRGSSTLLKRSTHKRSFTNSVIPRDQCPTVPRSFPGSYLILLTPRKIYTPGKMSPTLYHDLRHNINNNWTNHYKEILKEDHSTEVYDLKLSRYSSRSSISRSCPSGVLDCW